ncbi:MAG TPA: CDP-alcohol phosphatidyltransferase family protein [Candidatus Bathyarchaeia archaeon]|nr:CDP-alcohol phosphatidyltransferase family protein [Candidatus Bathyarchaeia archaeon]
MTTLSATAVAWQSLLVVVEAHRGSGAPSPATIIAGIPLLRRLVLSATRAGFDRVLVHPRLCPDRRLIEGTGAAVLGPETPVPPSARLVLLPVNVLPQARWLRVLRDMPLEPETLAVDGSLAAAAESVAVRDLLRSAGESGDAEELIATLSRRLTRVAEAHDPTGCFPLGGAAGADAAEAWLLRSLIKNSEGFMSRHVERRISLAITRRLATTRITPNAMTLVSLAVGFAGAAFFLSTDRLFQVIGALLFLSHSILDGCDGELARLKFLESRAGARLDFWGDNLVHVAVWVCMAIGWSLSEHAAWPLGIGALAVAGNAASAWLVNRQGGDNGLAEPVANRDFIYLVVGLAFFGVAQWFLVLVAVGTPIFMLLVRLGAGRGRTG